MTSSRDGMGRPTGCGPLVAHDLQKALSKLARRFPNTVIVAGSLPPAGRSSEPTESAVESVWVSSLGGGVRRGEAVRLAASTYRAFALWICEHCDDAGIDRQPFAGEVDAAYRAGEGARRRPSLRLAGAEGGDGGESDE